MRNQNGIKTVKVIFILIPKAVRHGGAEVALAMKKRLAGVTGFGE
jgi:hypothetical protein